MYLLVKWWFSSSSAKGNLHHFVKANVDSQAQKKCGAEKECGAEYPEYPSGLCNMKSFGYIQYILGLPPTQDSSHHQDYYIFSGESQPKPSFATGILGGG